MIKQTEKDAKLIALEHLMDGTALVEVAAHRRRIRVSLSAEMASLWELKNVTTILSTTTTAVTQLAKQSLAGIAQE